MNIGFRISFFCEAESKLINNLDTQKIHSIVYTFLLFFFYVDVKASFKIYITFLFWWMGLQEKCKTFNKSSMLTQILSIHNYPPTNSHHFYVFSVPKYIFALYSLNSIQTISICSFGKICVKVLSRKIILEWQRKFWKNLYLQLHWKVGAPPGQAGPGWLMLALAAHSSHSVKSSEQPQNQNQKNIISPTPRSMALGNLCRIEHYYSLNCFASRK